jgi:hypothetical protein
MVVLDPSLTLIVDGMQDLRQVESEIILGGRTGGGPYSRPPGGFFGHFAPESGKLTGLEEGMRGQRYR